ncbi:MAG: MFS transporter [Gammaproteobacteria bacterium]|nr:MFS transporter [Gammaproteobacteria bacterium]
MSEATAYAGTISTQTHTRLPTRRLLAYALIEFPVGGAMNATSLFLGFHYASLGVDLAEIGLIMMVARLIDVLIDPAVGLMSDRTRIRYGRRKIWVIAGAPVFVLACWNLFVPPDVVTATYFAGWLILFWLGFSMINIPYYAWGAELSPDYHERTRITTWRTIVGTLGSFSFLLIPAIRQEIFGVGGQPGEVLAVIAVVTLFAVPALVAFAALNVPDREMDAHVQQVPLMRGIRVMAGNAPFLRLLAAFTIVGLGPVLQGAMFPFFIQHVVGDTTSGPKILLIYYPTVACGILVWAALARRVDKHRAWMTGMTMMAIVTVSYMLVGQGDLLLMTMILGLSGIASGALSALPASMKADVVDLDAVESGEDRAGLFFAVWSLAVKFIAAVGQGLAFTTLAWIGFEAKGSNSPDEIFGLRVFYSAGPMVLYVIALLLVWGYPITSKRHAELRRELAERRESAGTSGVS